MGLVDLFRPRSDVKSSKPADDSGNTTAPDLLTHIPQGAERAALIQHYKHLRAVGMQLNLKLVKSLSKEDLHEGGRRLGILRRGILCFNSEDESSILMDYCINDLRRDGQNAVERYLTATPADRDPDETVILQATLKGVYSVYETESVERGLGVTVRDPLSNKRYFVIDLGLSTCAKPGFLTATRLLMFDGYATTGGAALPLGILPREYRELTARALSEAIVIDSSGRRDAAVVIRECLKSDHSSNIVYQDVTGEGGKGAIPESISQRHMRKIGRNEPCPCGSGKKYKFCCINRL